MKRTNPSLHSEAGALSHDVVNAGSSSAVGEQDAVISQLRSVSSGANSHGERILE